MSELKNDSETDEAAGEAMEKKISFGNFIAHLIPGVVALLAISPIAPASSPQWINRNEFVLSIAFLSTALACGLFLDCFRYILFKAIASIPSRASLHRYKRVPARDQIHLYDWIIDNTWRHHQFAGNLCLATCLFMISPPPQISRWIIGGLILVLAVTAWLLYNAAITQLNEAFPDRQL